MSKPKKGPIRLRTKEELQIDLHRQINFLRNSCSAFDHGLFDEAIRLSVAIRILLHDTGSSTSLLKHMGIKDNIDFIDTSDDLDSGFIFNFHGLVYLESRDGYSGYVATLDGNGIDKTKKFDDWWKKTIMKDKHGNEFTRQDLVLAVANQDGGAHIDSEIEEKYAQLSRDHSLGWEITNNGVFKKVPDVVWHSLRQVAHEVLRTLQNTPDLFSAPTN